MFNNLEFVFLFTGLPVPVLSAFRQCCGSGLIESGSMLFVDLKSGSRSRFLMTKNSIGKFNILGLLWRAFNLQVMRRNLQPQKVFLLITFWKYLYHSSQIKSHKEVKNSRSQGFSYYFCLMTEGFGPESGGPILYRFRSVSRTLQNMKVWKNPKHEGKWVSWEQ